MVQLLFNVINVPMSVLVFRSKEIGSSFGENAEGSQWKLVRVATRLQSMNEQNPQIGHLWGHSMCSWSSHPVLQHLHVALLQAHIVRLNGGM